ncbi:MAG TPA: DUF4388 domain-containing protein [Kofleriaceae bacterium]
MGAQSVLVVADPDRVSEIASALATASVEAILSSGGDDTIDLFHVRQPPVVVITASLELGDATSLIDTLRGMVPRMNVAFVVIGDDSGPIRTALDAMEMAPDRFLTRPLDAKALRFAVQSCLDAVALRTTQPTVRTHPGLGVPAAIDDDPTAARTAMRARWEALADSISSDDADVPDEPAALPPPIEISPARHQMWQPGSTSVPVREHTLIIRGPDEMPTNGKAVVSDTNITNVRDPDNRPPRARTESGPQMLRPPALSRTATWDYDGDAPSPPRRHAQSEPPDNLEIIERGGDDPWSNPVPIEELIDKTGDRIERIAAEHLRDDLPSLDDFADELMVGRGMQTPPPLTREDLDDEAAALEDPDLIVPMPLPEPPPPPAGGGRDFARQLREKMSMMAQRLFAGDAQSSQGVDLRPRHDHHTEIDLAALGEETPLNNNVTEIERNVDARELQTSPGSWDTQVRERGLPDSGEIVRGISDASLLLAKLFAQTTTGRIGFRKDEVEKVVHFDQGRPVWASSNEPGDRMGELLVREGKITASQYERCQAQVAQSGRRMGEILVDFGYLKRRELLPAVRRHVEDIVYSLFGWERGHYLITVDTTASVERIRLSRHPAALVLEGIRRKLDRSTLERLVGPASTVIEVRDKERLGGIINTADLVAEERACLAAIDGQADLSTVARNAGIDVADILPLAWGLVVLGLAVARRADQELEESTALVGDSDLAIDRERVRARWELVSEADYFALLGVRHDATAFEIRRAYQSARRDFAADCFTVDLRRELARELDDIATVLDEAFRVLRDDRLRVTYLSNLLD